MVGGIAHAAFCVKDMEKTVEFYEKTLGFKKAFEINEPDTGKPWIVYVYGGGGQYVELFYGGKKKFRMMMITLDLCIFACQLTIFKRPGNGWLIQVLRRMMHLNRVWILIGNAGHMTRME